MQSSVIFFVKKSESTPEPEIMAVNNDMLQFLQKLKLDKKLVPETVS